MSVFNKHAFKCDCCGIFFSIKDIENGSASHIMTSPDSDYSIEDYESLCEKCVAAVKGA